MTYLLLFFVTFKFLIDLLKFLIEPRVKPPKPLTPIKDLSDDLLQSLSKLHLKEIPSILPTAGVRPRTVALFHAFCKEHRYIRNKKYSEIVERPERLDAIRRAFDHLVKEAGELFQVTECSRLISLYDSHVLEIHDFSFVKNFESWCLNSLDCIKELKHEVCKLR